MTTEHSTRNGCDQDPCWPPECGTPTPCKAPPCPSAKDLLLLPYRLVATSLYGAADVVRKTLDGSYEDCCPICLKCHDKYQDCCEIPETLCPSQCVGRIVWTGCPEDSFKYPIQVTNRGDVEREFNLTTEPFPCTTDSVKVVPNKKTLAPDESLQAIASFSIPKNFGGSTYVTRIWIAGAYKQYIQVVLKVRPQHACCLVVEQGEIPKKIRAHQWYHHFQCEELCFAPADKAGRL